MNMDEIKRRMLDVHTFPIFAAMKRAERGFEISNVDEFLTDLLQENKDNK